MFNNIPTYGLSIVKILSGVSKTLNIANQIVPLYKEIKPTISSAKTFFTAFKNLDFNKKNEKIETTNLTNKKDFSANEKISKNQPVFFN